MSTKSAVAQSWGYAGGKGILNKSSTSYSIPGASVGAITKLLVECSCKQVAVHGDPPCPSSVVINGVTVGRISIPYDPNPWAPNDTYPHYIYRREFTGNVGNTVTYSTPSGAASMRGMAVFVTRNSSSTDENDPSVDSYGNGRGFFYGGWHYTTTDVESCSKSRTGYVTIPLHEHGNDGKYARYYVKPEFGPAKYVSSNGNNNLGSELRRDVISVTIPPNSTYIRIGAISDPNTNAASFILGSVMSTVESCCPDFNPSTSHTDPLCHDSFDGSITVSASCPSGCEYSIDGGSSWQSSNVFTGLGQGTYNVEVRNSDNSCETAVQKINLFGPAAIEPFPHVQANVTCAGFCNGEASISATGGIPPYSFTWSNGETTAGVSGLCAGDYTVSVTDDHACTSTAQITITEPDPLMVSVEIDSISCHGECDAGATVVITGGTPPFIYTWSTGGIGSSVEDLCAGEYHVIVADANSCLAALCFTITEPDTLIASAVANSGASCYGFSDGSATANGTGGTPPYTYEWDNNENTQTATMLDGGTHTVSVTDQNGCLATAMVEISEPTEITPTATENNSVSCYGLSDGAATVNATGGIPPYTYEWDNGETTQTATNLNGGIHTVTVTDQTGCQATTIVEISEPKELSATATEDNGVSCYGLLDGAATANATGGTPPYNYEWDNNETAQTAILLSGGTHVVSVTDQNGCLATAMVEITEPAVLTATITEDEGISCAGESDATATASATGGTPPYSYQWDNGQNTQTATGLAPGIHQVLVVDANGCADSTFIEIEPVAPLEVIDIITVDASCDNSCDGGVEIIITGGTPPYTYEWENGETTETISGLCAGLYHATITDANGCVLPGVCGLVKDPAPIEIVIDLPVDSTCTGSCNGEAVLSINNGLAPYTIAWSDGGTGDARNNLCGGAYTITVTDANGCEEIGNLEIETINCEIECVEEQINFNNFDSNWGVWSDGGADCRRSANDAAYSSGGIGRCVRLRDNTATSTTTTANLDLSGYSEITVAFTYLVRSFEGSEDFWLQISKDGGSSFTTVEDWVNGIDFANDVRGNDTVTIAGPFPADTKLRFRADASGNSDWVYLDNISIEGCKNSVIASSALKQENPTRTNAPGQTSKERFVEFAPAFKLYPNPAAENFVVSFNLAVATDVQLSVINITGKVMETRELGTVEGEQNIRFDGSQYMPGYYFVTLSTKEGVTSKKLLIAR